MEDKHDSYFGSKQIIRSSYMPAFFCAILSGMALLASIFDASWWKPAFFAFLPMCFYFYALTMHAVIKKVRRLEAVISNLNNENN